MVDPFEEHDYKLAAILLALGLLFGAATIWGFYLAQAPQCPCACTVAAGGKPHE